MYTVLPLHNIALRLFVADKVSSQQILSIYVIHFPTIHLHHGDNSLLLPHTIVSSVYPHSDITSRFT
jgi:hypothetical protein